ncbi:MAG: hypothetical protein HY855_18905 [Burkholderiales bacterium]|nr:hypothetical protein [Burkholderiales bacterium]
MHLIRLPLLAGTCLVLLASTAHAIGFGRAPSSVVLGSPLDFVLPLRLDASEIFEPECVSAELQIGERRVPPHNLRWVAEPGPAPNEYQVRVISLVVIDEPVVTVQVQAGCTARVVRRFTVFADPPLAGVAAPSVVQQPAGEPGARAATQAAAGPAASTPAKPARQAARSPAARARRDAGTPARRVAAKPATAAPGARLSLDAPDPQVLERAVAAALAQQQASAAQAVQAASAAQAAASSAADRVQALERQVAGLLAEARAQEAQLQALRVQAGRSGQAERWLPWLGAALAISLALAAWLAWRLRQLQQQAHPAWWADAAAVLADARPDADAAPAEPATAPQPGMRPVAEAPRQRHAAPAAGLEVDLVIEPIEPEPDSGSLAPAVDSGWTNTSPPPRPVSIEELIDLEQQAEFFVVLGQDESAIDLLVGHLRDTGGTSPLPYLKLLEIYRRRGDHEAYERTRTRFNQRFNAYAPEWATDILQGRALEDYPQVMMRLQRAWASPIDAMAELESLLFRKDGGELFELPAYREVLMLYSLARDLLDHQGALVADVDVLLPLGLPAAVDDGAAGPGALSLGETTAVITPDLALDRAPQRPAVDLDLDLPPPAQRSPA